MRSVRILVSVSCGLLAALTLAPAASAGDCHCDCPPVAVRAHGSHGALGVHCTPSGRRSVRDANHPSTRYVIPRTYRNAGRYGAYGSSWTVLRRHLRSWDGLPGGPYGAAGVRRAYVRSYFLRRFPFAALEGKEAVRLDALLARAEASEGNTVPLPPEAALQRGMARFFTAEYDGARQDFEAVLAAAPTDARARYGRLLCAVCRSDWKQAADDLDRLATTGDVRADDRLDADGAFADPAVLPSVIQGLRGYTRYQFTDGAAHLVAAWALAGTGEPQEARRHARMARRWRPSGDALPVLERNLGLTAGEPSGGPAQAPTAAPVRAPRVPGEGPATVVADAGKDTRRPGPRIADR